MFSEKNTNGAMEKEEDLKLSSCWAHQKKNISVLIVCFLYKNLSLKDNVAFDITPRVSRASFEMLFIDVCCESLLDMLNETIY